MASMSVSGVVSGMDWDSMIDSIIESASAPAQPKVSKKTDLLNKKSLFEEMKVTMNSLQSSLSPLKLPSTYKAKQVDIERIDSSSSYKGVLTATVNADAEVNVYDIKVNQIATAQINRSKQITSSTLASTLGSLTNSTLYVSAGGQKVGIEVKATDSLESLKSRINTTLKTLDNPIHVTALVLDNKLILKSDNTGLGTYTNEEKINYNISGVNTLSNFTVDENNLDNLSITSGSKKYTIHKDYTIVNGNEIRWKQYDRSAEVALNDTVNVKYTMAANDVYTASGTYGTNEADISDLSWIDNGTLASRLKITAGTDEYIYDQDFTIKNGKVVWLEDKSAATNEPSSYTVSYNKNEVKTASASATKSAVGPTSYTVSYSKTTPIASVTMNSGNQTVTSYSFDGTSNKSTFTDFLQGYADAEGLGDTSNLSQRSTDTVSGYLYDYVKNMGNISIDGYEYGKDYVFRKGYGNNANTLVISWNYSGDSGWSYVEDYRTNILGDTTPVTYIPIDGNTHNINYTHKYEYNTNGSGDALSDVLATALSDSGGYSGLVVTDSDGNTYSYDNGDFSIIGGQIIWNLTSDDDIGISNVTAKYNTVNGTDEIPRVTLTDGNGVLRTYLDLSGDSSFTMTDQDGKTYEYGRDYVVRVNDNGDGYVVTWAIASDTNGDGKKDIKDADTVLTTYAQYKELSTYGMQAAPDTDKTFDFAFEGTSTTPITGNVNSTDTDKTLTTVLRGTSVSTSDYSSLSITSGTKKYYYGVDFGVDSSGSIVWRDSASGTMPTSYTVNYAAKNKTLSTSDTGTLTSGSSGFPDIDALIDTYGFKTIGNSNITLDVYNADSPSDYEFVITPPDSSGDYVYGRDYVIQKVGSSASRNSLIAWGSQYSTYTNAFKTYINSHPSDYDQDTYNAVNGTQLSKPTSNYTVSLVHKADSSNLSGVSACINEANGDYSNMTITDSNNKTYTYVADTASLTDDTFTIVDGLVTFKTAEAPNHPTGSYTLTYEASGGESLATEGVKRSATDSITGTPAYSDLSGGTTTITQGSKTFYEGVDFNITKNSSTSEAQIEWISDSDGDTEWYYPNPGSTYTINHTDDNGNTTTYTGTRNSSASLDMSDYGMATANGSISVQYGSDDHYYRLDAEPDYDDDGNPIANTDGRAAIKTTHSIDITPTTGGTFNFKWVTPTLTSRTDLPSLNEELTVTYDYDANVYTLTDDGDGLVDLLGLNDDVTAAQNAELVIDGQTITPASNDIGADYNNEIKGMEGITLHLKGVGEVSLDISHDAEKAVESIQTFVDTYNDLMTWMNTRMTESQVDEDTAATIDSDDFRMRWGLLHGNSLLRQTKSQMRNITSQNFTFSFTQRKSSEEVYGTMGFNGLKTSSTLRLRIGTKYVDVTIDPADTLETIVKKISDDTKGGAMNDIYYDDNGNKLPTALLKASVENDKLVITSSSSDEITMSGTAAMNALKMNYTYKGLYQIGIESTSEDYGKSGELVFNSSEFMEALENNPDEVQALMLKFVEQFSTWTRGMLNSSASGETSGTLTREIENIQSQVDDINEYLEKYQERLDRMEESLRTRYANTETSLAKLNQQASSIAAILNQLNGMGGNNNSSSGS